MNRYAHPFNGVYYVIETSYSKTKTNIICFGLAFLKWINFEYKTIEVTGEVFRSFAVAFARKR